MQKNAYEKQNLCEDTHIRVTSTPHLGSLPPAPSRMNAAGYSGRLSASNSQTGW